MPTILEALAVIKGKDSTGNTFDSIANKIQRISKAANALNRDVQKQLNIASAAGKQVERLERASSAIGNGARLTAGAAATYGAERAATALIEHTAKAAAARAHEEVRMSASGMSDNEIKEASDLRRCDVGEIQIAFAKRNHAHRPQREGRRRHVR